MSIPLHILVVDDRPDTVLFLTEFLRSRNHRIVPAGNGRDALEIMLQRQRSRDNFDLVISDVTMPVMDGLNLVRELRRRQLSTPVVLYTAYGAMNPDLNQQASQAGVMAVLDKPIELRRVETLLDEVAARRSGTGRRLSSDDQPFFGTGRTVKPASTRVERREPDTAPQTPTTGALERRRSDVGYAGDALIPMTPPPPPISLEALKSPSPLLLPFPDDATPLPQSLQGPPPQPIRTPLPNSGPRDGALMPPPPIRTPLPFIVPPNDPQHPHAPVHHSPVAPPPGAQQSHFRTPIPGAPHTGGFHRPAAMRTPLPFLVQQPTPPPAPAPPPPPAPIRTPHPNNPATGHQPASDPGNQVGQYPTTSFLRRSVEPPVKGTGYVRRPSGLFLSQQPPEQPGTSRIRRGVTGSHTSPPTAPLTSSFTSRRPPVPPSHDPASRAVACAHCRKVFMVAVKRDSYTMVCVHCGQLNRIDPL